MAVGGERLGRLGSPDLTVNSLDEPCVPEHEPATLWNRSWERNPPSPFTDVTHSHMCRKLDRRIRSPAPLMKVKLSLGKLATASPRQQFFSGITNAHRHLRRLEKSGTVLRCRRGPDLRSWTVG